MELGSQILAGLFQPLFDHVFPNALFIHDHEGRFHVVNDEACRSVGFTREELLTMCVTDLEQDFDLAAAQAVWATVQADSKLVLRGHQRRKDGSVFPVQVRFGLLESAGQRFYFGSVIDTSEQVKAEEALRHSELQLRTMFEAMSEGLVLQIPGGQIVEANHAAEAILGLTREQLLGRTSTNPEWKSVHVDGTDFPGEDHPAMVCLRTGQRVRGHIMGVKDPRTDLRWISINAEPVYGSGSSGPSAVVTTFIDVTDQRNLAEELRLAQADLKAILDNVPARIASWYSDYTNRFINQKAERDFGLAASTAVGMHVRDIIGEERFARAKQYIDAALAGETQSHEQIDRQPDGAPRYSLVSYIPKRRDGAVVGLYTLATNVTELHDTYERIRELAQRLESIREDERRSVAHTLHEGLAQDLFALKLGLDHLESQSYGRAGVQEVCKQLTEALSKCVADTRHLANALRPTALAHMRVSVALKEHAVFFGERAKLLIDVRELAPFPELNESARLFLFRAAQEALTNVARHAHASSVEITLRADSGHVVMDVIDDGIGLAPGAPAKPGSLGLLGLRERAQALGGGLTVVNNRGAGTKLSVRVPVASIGNARSQTH